MSALSRDQVRSFARKGFVGGISVLAPMQASRYREQLRAFLNASRAEHGPQWSPGQYDPEAEPSHPLAELFMELGTLPRLLDAVEALLGPELLIRNGDVFIKEPGVWEHGIGWHLDTSMQGPNVDTMVTAFVALSETTKANGCLQFSAGTHARVLPGAPESKDALTLSAKAVASLRRWHTRACPLDAGQASLHHFRTAHRSGWNRSKSPRVAFVVRFMTPDTLPETAECGTATLARGARLGRFSSRARFPVSWQK